MQGGGMKTGRTIVAEREKMESESERQLLREKEQKKKRISVAIYVAVFLVVVAAVFLVVKQIVGSQVAPENKESEMQKYEPSVQIVDESGANHVTERVKKYVGMLERDLVDYGLKVERVVLPADKTREVDVYVSGRGEYYKCNLDRGTAVTAEDISRMSKYLAEHGLGPGYVDVRVEGKAYYK